MSLQTSVAFEDAVEDEDYAASNPVLLRSVMMNLNIPMVSRARAPVSRHVAQHTPHYHYHYHHHLARDSIDSSDR